MLGLTAAPEIVTAVPRVMARSSARSALLASSLSLSLPYSFALRYPRP